MIPIAWSLAACTGPGGTEAAVAPPPTAVPGPAVRMDLRASAGLFDGPVPGQHRWASSGPRIDDWPNPDAVAYVDALLGAAATMDGFGTTSGVLFALDAPAELVSVDVLAPDTAPAFLVALDGVAPGERVPIDVTLDPDGGPFGAPNLITLLPLQGVPLRPHTTYAGVLLRSLGVEPLGVPVELVQLSLGQAPAGWEPEVVQTWADALTSLDVPAADVAGLTVFRTGDPTLGFATAATHARATAVPSVDAPPALTEMYDTFCVFETTVQMPDYQAGEPPFDTQGGWAWDDQGLPVRQGDGDSRMWITVPRSPAPPGGFPTAVMVRTGGGGDRPLIDRGLRAEPGGEPIVPGSGPALTFAAAGWAGVQVDGPHGGARNVTGGDEQFLMFNIGNPIATRDNVRQSALELALLPAILEGVSPLDGAGCDGADPTVALDLQTMALMGHSMGATIAPLTATVAPEYDAVILSGAGGSYLHNLVHKQSPIEVRPVAELLLNYTVRGRTLTDSDAVLQLLQWAAEPADPPVYGPGVGQHVLMVQGIVDTYILPPMANATSLSLGLDLARPALDATHPDLATFRPLEPLLPLVGAQMVTLPIEGDRVRVVLQQAEGPIEDGHEVLFQTEAPQHAMRCFLEGVASGEAGVPAPGGVADPCW